jgi:diacylglycerol kinase (ATP)
LIYQTSIMINESQKFNIRARLASFKYAFRGIWLVVKKEHNMWIHLLAAFSVIVLGFIFQITGTEFILIILCIGLVFIAEIINTAIEKLADIVSPRPNEKLRTIKDMAAGAVLVSAIVALISGILVFWPHLRG